MTRALEMLNQYMICWGEDIEDLRAAIKDEEVSREDVIHELNSFASGFKHVARDIQEGK